MSRFFAAALLLSALALPAAGVAQQRSTAQRCAAPAASERARSSAVQPRPQGEYDVVLEVPELCVETIQLDVQNLDAHLSLNARVANLVRVNAGADVTIGTVSLGLRGVEAEALLLVDLDNVVFVVDRTLAFIDRNPQVVTGLFRTTQGALTTVGDVGARALGPDGAVSGALEGVGGTLERTTRP